ncbi:MAG: choice-of-anchor Q domain-containing protein [Planctomycetaceae bacterium]
MRFRKSRRRQPAMNGESLEVRTLLSAFTVTNLNDSGTGSLREAIANANASAGMDTISFAVTGTILLSSGQLTVTDSVSITGPGAGQLAVSGNHQTFRVFLIDNSATSLIDVTISDLTIRDAGNGVAALDGAGVRNGENLTMNRVIVSGNQSGSQGGGGIQCFDGNFVLQNSAILNNSANQGGGLEFFGVSHLVINTTISGNQATGHVGGLLALIGPTTVRSSTITNNRGDADGNGIGENGGAAGNPDLLTLHNTIVAGNFVGTGTQPLDAAHLTSASSHNLIGFAGAEVGLIDGVNGNIVGVNGIGTRAISSILDTTLRDNGGPTPTYALAVGSPAIDSGDIAQAVNSTGGTLGSDQRGGKFGRVLDGDHLGGAVLDIGAFESPGIRVNSPNPNAFTLRPTFTWTAIAGATLYNIQINNESTGQAQFHLATASTNSYTPTVDLAIGKFRMWIRPIFNGTPGNWSAPQLFTNLTPTTWQSISRTQLTSRPTLSWTALPGATKYDLWINNQSTGQQQLIRQEITGTSWTPTTDLAMGLYRAWIRGKDAAGNFATWSVLQELLVVPGPTPIGPLSGTFDRAPTFSWSPVTGAASYEVSLRNLSTNTMVLNGQLVAGTSFTPASNLTDGLYRWWAVAVSPANIGPIKSGGSTATDIYVGGRPTLIAPVAGATSSDRTPAFTWRAIDGAASYNLFVNRTDVAQAGVINQSGLTGTSFTPATDLARGTYRAWVRAVSATSELSPWSIEVNFTLTSNTSSGAVEVLLTSVLVPNLMPETGEEAVRLRVKSRESADRPTAEMVPMDREVDKLADVEDRVWMNTDATMAILNCMIRNNEPRRIATTT